MKCNRLWEYMKCMLLQYVRDSISTFLDAPPSPCLVLEAGPRPGGGLGGRGLPERREALSHSPPLLLLQGWCCVQPCIVQQELTDVVRLIAFPDPTRRDSAIFLRQQQYM